MQVPGGLLPLNSQRPFIQLMVSLLVVLAISSVLLLISILAGRFLFGDSVADTDLSSATITAAQRNYLKFIQAMSQLSLFLVPGLVISWFMSGNISGWLGLGRAVSPAIIALVILLALSCIPLTSLTGVLNSKMEFPDWMNFIEKWMQAKEERASALTSHIVYASGTGGMILNLVVLALIPAAGEEIFFRGVLQQIFQKWFRSGYTAVVVTALLFTTLHFQFYGFLPRLILGILFGLLFLWSRSVWLPFIAHLVNNTIPVIVSYYSGWINVNDNIGEYIPPGWYPVILMIVVPAALLFIIYDYYVRDSNG